MSVIVRDCPHCPAQHSSFTIKWEEKGAHGYLGLGTCGACGLPITFHATDPYGRGRSPSEASGDIEETWQVGAQWPTRTAALAPAHTPQPVARRFLEGEDAYRRGSWNAAVAMYRSALDIGTKGLEGVPSGQTFYARLKWLHENHRITPDMWAWADHVRVEGNEALHDPDDFTEADARPLRLFTETFLRYVFELPGEVRAFRGQAPEDT